MNVEFVKTLSRAIVTGPHTHTVFRQDAVSGSRVLEVEQAVGPGTPSDPVRIGTAHAELTVAWPKHGYASRAHATFLHALPRAATP
jgi:hypothetical protein